MGWRFGLIVAATLTMSAASAVAQSRAPAPRTEFTFENEDVRGERDTSGGTRVQGQLPLRRTTLVRARTHFVPELLSSVESL